MRKRRLYGYLAAVFVTAMFVPSLHADWTGGGVELCTVAATQMGQWMVSDGAGGAIVCWHDEREGPDTWDVYAQRVDNAGNIMWDAAGVNVSQLGMSQLNPHIVSDGAGGAIIVYQNDRGGDWDIYAQRIRPDGSLAWPAGGLMISAEANSQTRPWAVPDDTGGAIVAWLDYRSGTSYDIYAARIDSTGNVPWTLHGVPVCTTPDDQVSHRIVTDGSSGAIIVWKDDRSGNSDIWAQRVIFNGSTVWTTNGVPVADDIESQNWPYAVSDMNGGAVVCYSHGSGSLTDIRAERILSDGTRGWLPPNGVTVCAFADIQYSPYIVSDGAGGAIIAWLDTRNGITDIYARNVDYLGGTTWPTNGVAVCSEGSTQWEHQIVSDGCGGAIILWTDTRYYRNYEIFGQHIDGGGSIHWQVNGRNLSDWPADQGESQALATEDGGLIVVWIDKRDDSNPSKLYAQKYDRYGYWGDPAPVITEAGDVPADQGGKVLLTWAPIRMDEYPEDLVTHYTIWRSVSAPEAMALKREGMDSRADSKDAPVVVTSPGEIGLDFEGKAYRTDIGSASAAAWEWVASVEAHYWDEYSYTCPTVQDSTGADDGVHYFVISANTADPFTFWDSEPDSACSVDNLAPCTPLGIAGEQSFVPEGLELSWSPSPETDLGGYNIYRGSDPAFEPSSDNWLATTCDTAMFDGGWTWDSGFCYKVAAVDIHGNESGYAILCMDQVTGDDPAPVPEAAFLAQNYPNPFNPSTTIAFGLRERGPVSLRIYDAAGRLVRELAGGSMDAGRYEIAWNGRDDSGIALASGIYFYRLMAGDFLETRKMVLLR